MKFKVWIIVGFWIVGIVVAKLSPNENIASWFRAVVPMDLRSQNARLIEDQWNFIGSAETERILRACMRNRDTYCEMLGFKKLHELDNRDEGYLANYAIRLNQLKRHREAVATFKKLQSRAPLTYDSWSYLGMSYEAMGKDQKAIRAYREALKIYPYIVDISERLSDLYIKNRDFKSAQEFLERQSKAMPRMKANFKRRLQRVQELQVKELNSKSGNQS
ncbi:MAG: tetratricopeptide repeat protein [Bdellovibrionales bacterium]|nr:tetratricopeptide repeat protein [Bdellovibrionales bacterium]